MGANTVVIGKNTVVFGANSVEFGEIKFNFLQMQGFEITVVFWANKNVSWRNRRSLGGYGVRGVREVRKKSTSYN